MWFQRAESAAVAVATAVALVELGFDWWWLLVLFVLFDVSMAGYVASPSARAWPYNAVHSHRTGPARRGCDRR